LVVLVALFPGDAVGFGEGDSAGLGDAGTGVVAGDSGEEFSAVSLPQAKLPNAKMPDKTINVPVLR
jgi:hypothetical protein